jgi:hypothetical protein
VTWKQLLFLPVGGLTEVGFSKDERYLLVISHSGRGVVDLINGSVVERDPEVPRNDSPWIDAAGKVALGIGPVLGVPFQMVGLWGGSLESQSHLGFTVRTTGGKRVVEVHPINSRDGRAVLTERPAAEIRAVGFSPGGRLFMIATSSDVALFESIERR